MVALLRLLLDIWRPRNGDTRPLSLSALDALQNTSGTPATDGWDGCID